MVCKFFSIYIEREFFVFSSARKKLRFRRNGFFFGPIISGIHTHTQGRVCVCALNPTLLTHIRTQEVARQIPQSSVYTLNTLYILKTYFTNTPTHAQEVAKRLAAVLLEIAACLPPGS